MIDNTNIVTALVVSFLVVGLSGCGPSEKELLAAKQAQEQAKINAFQDRVVKHTNDPVAAQFRDVKLIKDTKGLCGEVNVKNQMGGYVGFKPFVIAAEGDPVILESIPPVELNNLSKKTKDERKAYVNKFAVQFGQMGAMGKGVSMLLDLEQLEKFQMWDALGECFQ